VSALGPGMAMAEVRGANRARGKSLQTEKAQHALEKENSNLKKQLRAYNSLKAKGVSDKTILRWEKILSQAGLAPSAVQRELVRSASLAKVEEQTKARIEKSRLALESVKVKGEELRRKYSTAWDSITRYQLLREMGVDGGVLQRWEKLLVGNGLDPVKIEDELLQHRNLNATRKELESRLVGLEAELAAATERLKHTEEGLAKLESQRTELLKSVEEITVHFRNSVRVMTDDATRNLGSVEAKAGEELQRLTADAQSNLNAALTAADGIVEGFRAKIEATYESALQTGEAIGRNEALKPLVRFSETGEGSPGEVIPLLSLLAHNLARWADSSDPSLAAKARELEEYLNGKLRGA
jgi:hypothetical protein